MLCWDDVKSRDQPPPLPELIKATEAALSNVWCAPVCMLRCLEELNNGYSGPFPEIPPTLPSGWVWQLHMILCYPYISSPLLITCLCTVTAFSRAQRELIQKRHENLSSCSHQTSQWPESDIEALILTHQKKKMQYKCNIKRPCLAAVAATFMVRCSGSSESC